MNRSRTGIVYALLMLVALLAPAFAPAVHAQQAGATRVYLPMVFQSYVTEMRLVAVADATIYEGAPDANQGAEYYLLTGNNQPTADKPGILRSLVRFDLPPGPRPVVSAILRISYAGYWDYPDQPRSIHVEASAAPWSETTITWRNQPARLAGQYGSVSIPGNENFGYREIDVTDLVKAWLEDATPNYGLYLIGPEASGSDASYRSFLSRETIGTDKPYPPELVIKF